MQTARNLDASTGSAIQPALQRVARLADLQPDWDSYGADPPSARAVTGAHDVLVAVNEQFAATRGEGVLPFTIAPLNDGGLQLEWRGPLAEIEVDIDPTGHLGYLFVDKSGAERAFVEQDEAAWPDVLAKIALTLSPVKKG